MKWPLLPKLLALCVVTGCATKPQPPAEFQSVPGPSAVSPEMAKLATERAIEINRPAPKTKAAEKKARKQTAPPTTNPSTLTPESEPSTSTPAPIVTPDATRAGKVMTYNEAGRFVVLNFPLDGMPAIGTRIFIFRSNLKVGEAKVTGPRRDDNIVADLVLGEAAAGDEVRSQ